MVEFLEHFPLNQLDEEYVTNDVKDGTQMNFPKMIVQEIMEMEKAGAAQTFSQPQVQQAPTQPGVMVNVGAPIQPPMPGAAPTAPVVPQAPTQPVVPQAPTQPAPVAPPTPAY